MNARVETLAAQLDALLAGASFDDAADALAVALARRVVAAQPSIAQGVGFAFVDLTVNDAPMRVNVFRKTPEMLARESVNDG